MTHELVHERRVPKPRTEQEARAAARRRGTTWQASPSPFPRRTESPPQQLTALVGRSFAFDLSAVRIHSGPHAERIARSIGAVAFTRGRDIFGGPLLTTPTPEGRRVLTHEAVHAAGQAHSEPHVQRLSRAGETGALLEWWDTADDAVKALDLLASMRDPDLEDTLADMVRGNQVDRLLGRLPGRAYIVRFLRLVGDRATPARQAEVMARYPFANMTPESQLEVYGRKHIATRGARPAPPDPALRSLVDHNPSAAFSGGGATGTSPAAAPMSVMEMLELRKEAKAAAGTPDGVEDAKYTRKPGLEMLYDWSNPLKGDLTGPRSWLGKLSPTDRVGQAELLLRQPIATRAPGAYGRVPTRAELIRSAATAHRLSPEVVAAIILAEQRDQSLREDAADYQGAVMGKRSSVSIGLGQVTVKTAREQNLFADLVSPSMQAWLAKNTEATTQTIAQMLASDDFNVFAVARYIRMIADQGARLSLAALPRTAAWTPGLNLSAYAGHSSTWTEEHVKLLGSEYTSKPWDDTLSEGWGEFVLEAYRDVRAAKVF
ncbi:eCIS core domain-containing protein [Streptomyces bobili]